MAAAAATTSTFRAKKTANSSNLLLGRYRLGKLLGQGTFAKVYLAVDPSTDQSFAIKVLDKQKILQSNLVTHIKREISILRRLRHPFIVHLFEVMATRSKIYFVMEYVTGGELFRKVAKGRLREDTARKYFQQLIAAVRFCHDRGVYHRDLKPENLLVDDNGDLKVSDFGLSAVADQIHQGHDQLFHTFCGTPAYVAPEVLARKGYDGAKVDIWSCGVILFVLMAGYLPFHDLNLMAMYKKIYRGEFRCPRWFSPELTRLLTRLLDTNPRTRITMAEIVENKWFKKGFQPVKFYIENDRFRRVESVGCNLDDQNEKDSIDSGDESDSSVASCPDIVLTSSDGTTTTTAMKKNKGKLTRPLSLNAFDIISFSRGFDLSGLFEENGEETRFITGEDVDTIVSKLEEIAKVVSFTVRRKDCHVSLEGTREGVKGPLTIGAEIFELTPTLMVVEVKKKAGDKEEYEEFCNRELKPGLRNLIMQQTEVNSSRNSSDTE